MKAKIVRIGNSQGIRIPKPLLEEAGLEGEVELKVSPEGLRITPAVPLRAEWAAAAALLSERGEDGLLAPGVPTRFDQEEWAW